MARYSRRVGPVASFQPTGTRQDIPGMFVTRFFDDGELLVSWGVRIFNGDAFPAGGDVEAQLDGVDVKVDPSSWNALASDRIYVSDCILVPISKGIHRIALTVSNFGSVGDVVTGNGAQLTLVQLPQWDSSQDIL